MKNHTIKTPTAELMIVEHPETGNTFDLLTAINSETEGYILLGKPDEIKEEDADSIVDTTIAFHQDGTDYLMWKNYADENDFCLYATESLLSLLETEIYWENPFGVNGGHLDSYKHLWKEAEQKTFDINRTLLFKKK